MWLHMDLIHDVMTTCKDIYPVVNYAYTTIPTYPSGQIGHIVACKDPSATPSSKIQSSLPL
jgi:spermidine synthase